MTGNKANDRGTTLNDGTAMCPYHQLWVCTACGKTARSKYGFDTFGKPTSEQSWDESCMLNSMLCEKDLLLFENGRVVQVLKHPDDSQGEQGGQG